jgi:transcriptional regulator GlxA family with amidase domain
MHRVVIVAMNGVVRAAVCMPYEVFSRVSLSSGRAGSLETLLRWMERNLREPLTLAQIARRAAMSVRSLNRHFREQTGTTPLQSLLSLRVRRAQQLLETTTLSVEHIATDAGFGSVTSLRDHLRRVVMTSPQAYRRAFRSKSAARSAQRALAS